MDLLGHPIEKVTKRRFENIYDFSLDVTNKNDCKIIFDDKGVCDHCNTYYNDILPNWHTDERGDLALKEIIKKIAKHFAISTVAIEIKTGHKSKEKIIEISN